MTHPEPKQSAGEVIQEKLKSKGWTQEELARVVGRYRPEISNIINGKRGITPDLAVALAAAFGDTSVEFWMQLESDRQLSLVKQDPDEVRQRARIYSIAPVREMEQRGWIKPDLDDESLERELCQFYGIESLDQTPSQNVATRKAAPLDDLTPAQVAWCARAKHLARAVTVCPFAPDRLDEAKAKLRRLAAYRKEARHIAETLGQYGIRFVIVEPLRKGKIDGAAFWLDESSPCIAVSVRFDRIDAFWFTVMHEFAHIRAGDASVDDDLAGEDYMPSSMKNEIERRADDEAQEALVPQHELRSFVRRVGPIYSKNRIVQFAHRIKIHPGIVVGQLHHLGEIGYSANREMLAKVRDIVTETTLTDGFGRTIPEGLVKE
jgi:HTH-type transcriptional regulator/antitoxin HigA